MHRAHRLLSELTLILCSGANIRSSRSSARQSIVRIRIREEIMNARIIQVRPSRNPRWQKKGGWEVFEAEGVCPVYCGETGRQNALDYAQQRAGYGRSDRSTQK